jgi:serine/threonine-protein kinase
MTTPFDTGQRTGRVGRVLRGTYRLVRLIGKGGMGEVYEATHVAIPRRFAVKLLVGDLSGDAEALARFHREANIAASLGSPHIVEVFDFNVAEDDSYYMAMEYLEGETLGARLAREGPLTPEAWLPLFAEVCEGLEVAHAAGIVHRDLKPDNLFLARGKRGEEVLKILDFGISKIRSSKTMHTQSGAVLGTPNYMSPEQAEGDTANADSRADIFSLGAIVYEVLSGQRAFDGPGLPSIMMKICFSEPPPLPTLAPHLPPGIIAAVTRAVAKPPADRFPDVRSFFEAYQAALAQPAPALAPPAPAIAAQPLPPRPQPSPQTTLSATAAELSAAPEPELEARPRPRWLLPAGLAGAAAVLAAVGVLLAGRGTGGSSDTSNRAASPPADARDAGAITTPILPDAAPALALDAAPAITPMDEPGRRPGMTAPRTRAPDPVMAPERVVTPPPRDPPPPEMAPPEIRPPPRREAPPRRETPPVPRRRSMEWAE